MITPDRGRFGGILEKEQYMDTLKILVVDDEARMRKLVRDFLVRKNYEVLEAGDGMEAMDVFYSTQNIALIILDVMMPKMDGWEVCREIRKESKVPIIMLTAKADERDEQLGFDRSTRLRIRSELTGSWSNCRLRNSSF